MSQVQSWREVSDLLDRALEFDAPSRETFLTELRVSRPDLAATLRTLLEDDDRLGATGFLSPPRTTTTLAMPSRAGEMIGAWKLERPLGQGGMGSVWLASRDDGRFEGFAAVKLLHVSRLDGTGELRFRQEGSFLARLSHPNIARLLDAGVTLTGQPYLVMEYVAGEPIDRYCTQRALSEASRIGLVRQVLDAVGDAHANLVVHRDIKPSNILVTEAGEAKLLDFGIAALLTKDGSALTASTSETRTALTPRYAAPEQMRGAPVTTATDVYACGVLLYLLLTGRHPTTGTDATPVEALHALLYREPTPLGTRDLDAVIAKALRKDAAERYQTVAAFSDDLTRYLQHEPVRARRASLADRAWKFARRHRAAVIGATIATASLIAATAISLERSAEARAQRDVALMERERADAQLEFQQLMLSEIGTGQTTMREILDKGRTLATEEFTTNAAVLSSVLSRLGQGYAALGESNTATAVFVRAESVARAIGDWSEVARGQCYRAQVVQQTGKLSNASQLLDSTDLLLRARPDPGAQAVCLASRAQVAQEAGDKVLASRSARRAVALLDSIGDTRGSTYIEAVSLQARALGNEGRVRDAIEVRHRALALMDSTGRGGTSRAVVERHNLGFELVKIGEAAEAESIFYDVVTRVARADPTGRIAYQPLVHYAWSAFLRARYDSALKYYTVLADQGAKDGRGFWEARGTFGMVRAQVRLQRVADARRTLQRFRRVRDTLTNVRTDDQIIDTRALEGELALMAGDAATAWAHFDDVLRRNKYFEGVRHRTQVPLQMLAAEAALALRRPNDALALAREAGKTARADSHSELRSGFLGEARWMEAMAQLALSDSAAALALLTQAVVALGTGYGVDHPLSQRARALQVVLTTGARARAGARARM